MSKFWNENDMDFDSDSAPAQNSESESEIENKTSTEDTQNSVPDNQDSTYHWVNPKLQQQEDKIPDAENADSGTNTYQSYQYSVPQYEKSKTKKKSSGLGKKFGLAASLAVVFGLVASVTFQGVNAIGNQIRGNNNETETVIPSTETVKDVTNDDTVSEARTTAASAGYSVADVASNAMPSVVSISNLGVQEIPNFFGGSEQHESTSSGSGIIVGQNNEELLVATNNHVVSGAKAITVTFIDDTSVEAQIKGTDSNNDLAVVVVKVSDLSEETLSKIKVATIGNSDNLVVGEQVVAIGNALGYGQSVTSGYISALDREVTVDNITANLIQTDAAINPGNSGGALLNMHGELIGINAVKFASNGVEGMGYAIPVTTAEPILGDLMSRVTRDKVDTKKASYLGISCKNVTSQTAKMYDMPVGVFVAGVTQGTAAEKAGMIKGDILTKFDDTNIATYDELVNSLEYYEAGETINIIVQRAEAGEYVEKTLTITLDEKPAGTDQQPQQDQPQQDQPQQDQLPQQGSEMPFSEQQ